LQLARLAVLAGFLILAALAGPGPLIAAAIGVLVARARVLKGARS
jgi:sorbitol-specific phosphotransferase system component IIBC